MQLPQGFAGISTFVFDMDGVLTDGTVWVLEDRRMIRRMSIKDGFALQLAIKKGFHIAVISGSTSPEVTERLKGLGITDIFMGEKNKEECLKSYLERKNIPLQEVLFMGDDIPDLSVMKIAGMACAPLDAVEEIKAVAHYISRYEGGKGCVREVIEQVLKLRNAWDLQTDIASR